MKITMIAKMGNNASTEDSDSDSDDWTEIPRIFKCIERGWEELQRNTEIFRAHACLHVPAFFRYVHRQADTIAIHETHNIGIRVHFH